ncbi:hypothetical protein GCM10011418_15830 [Sphingobacterium alkalisoli]|uniref:DUF5958 family protein n=1 Tax=Sphingobacterium alkalisoli TaxID=1874115 RepID=UPI0019ACA019|nr:hypothetical protein GCM10011418_15830 [Sphingobacterium alkalisoli]
MTNTEILINRIAQDRIEFHEGCTLLLDDTQFNFDELFVILRNYIFNSIPEKTSYSTEAYQNAIRTIPLKPTFTPIVILNSYPTKIAFNKLSELPEIERKKTIKSLLWIFKITDTERRNSKCKDRCGHEWHNIK